ncbi:hypothetical protein CHELA41_23642 [Hyphomicrobiales bacterium]|nr:hypothetical protein CHELA41_23642 [Hyphomicrobiales bacterium]
MYLLAGFLSRVWLAKWRAGSFRSPDAAGLFALICNNILNYIDFLKNATAAGVARFASFHGSDCKSGGLLFSWQLIFRLEIKRSSRISRQI